MAALNNIITLLKSTFEKHAWYGPSVKETIKDIKQEHALKKLENTHTIIELVNHMTSWRRYVINKIADDIQFKMTEELNFPAETNWETSIKKLEDSQSALLKSLEKFSEEKLFELVPFTEHQYTYYTLFHGIIHHDIYHAGQIVIIRKHFGF